MNADLRLALPVAVAWIATAVLLGLPAALVPVAVITWSLAIGAAVLAVIFRSGSRMNVLVIFVVTAGMTALVLSAAVTQNEQRSPTALIEAATGGRFVSATAVTTQTLQSGTARFTATLTSATIAGRQSRLSAPVTVFGTVGAGAAKHGGATSGPWGSAAAPIGIGATIELSGTLAATDPGDDVSFLFFAAGPAGVRAGPPWYLDWANDLRAGFAGAAATLPGDGGRLLPGLAIGDTSAVGAGLDTAMKASSLSHLTAVSGANCAVVIALVMAAGGALGMRRGWRIVASVIALLGFVVLVTPQPSVLRAAVMALLVLAALGSGRPVRGVPVLALAVLVLLVQDPWLARSYGFVLSVLATGGLLVLSRPLTIVLSRWLPKALAAVIAIPLAAQLACQPVLILLNPSIPLYAVPANMLAEPAAPLATVLGLVACLMLPWLQGPGLFVAWLAWLPSSWIAGIAKFFDSLPGNSIPWLSGAPGAVLVSAIILLALVLVLRRDDRGRRSRRFAAAAMIAILVVYLGVIGGDRLRQLVARPQDWQIAACDIGQGDAMLVRSAGQIALIDTGPDPVLLTHCLDVLGVARVDLLLLTHYDLDHVGGAPAVLGRVTRAMVGPQADSHDAGLAQSLRDAGAEVGQVSRGETGRLGELRWTVLWPPTRLGELRPGNDSSVTLQFAGVGKCASGCLSSLFLGDLGEQPQARMMAANRQLGRVDVVKVAHHGSADQSAGLYEKIRASVGIIGVGAHNRYGHPTDHLLQILAKAGTVVERTDQQGMVLISPRPDGGLSLWSERAPSASDGARE